MSDPFGAYSKQEIVSWSPYVHGTEYYSDGRKFDRVKTQTVRRTNVVNFGQSTIWWREYIRFGGNATTSLDGLRYSANIGSDGVYTFSQIGDPGRYGSSFGAFGAYALHFGDPGAIPSTTADSKALSSLLQGYIKARTAVRGGNIIAEFRDTVRLFRNPIKSLFGSTVNFARNVRKIRGLRNGSKEYAKLLGGYWLQWAFAIKPLLADIADINKSVTTFGEVNKHDTLPIRGKGTDRKETGKQVGLYAELSGIYNACQAAYDVYYHTTASVRYKGAIRTRPGNTAGIAEHFGVDIYDILPAAWEAIPWSFLVDYFVNVGEQLDAMRLASADLAWLNRTIKTWSTVTATGVYRTLPNPSGGYTSFVGGGAWSSDVTRVTRVPIIVIPVPPFRFQIPGMESINKWINMAALTTQIQASRPRR